MPNFKLVPLYALSLRFSLLILVCLSLTDVKGQEKSAVVTKSRFEARIEKSTDQVHVRVEYEVKANESGPIPLRGLLFDHEQLNDIKITLNNKPVTVKLTIDNGLVSGEIPALAQESSNSSAIQLSYALTLDAQQPDIELIIPIVYVNWPSEKSMEEPFLGSITLPDGYEIIESFPSTGWQLQGDNQYQFEIPAIPSMVRVKASSTGKPLFTFTSMVDLLVIIILLVFMGLAWRKLKVSL